jgi:alpha-D-ribose 1-methylphosphonate 5-triphosphate diphosphatase PhnM
MEENLANLNPSTNREWLQYISRQLDDIKESAAEDRETVADYMKKTDAWIKCHDDEYAEHIIKAGTYCERVDNLVPQVRGWNIANSIVAGVAAVLAYIGFK